MSYKQYRRRKKEITMQQLAQKGKKKHEAQMKDKKVIYIPHPTTPNTMIEKVIE